MDSEKNLENKSWIRAFCQFTRQRSQNSSERLEIRKPAKATILPVPVIYFLPSLKSKFCKLTPLLSLHLEYIYIIRCVDILCNFRVVIFCSPIGKLCNSAVFLPWFSLIATGYKTLVRHRWFLAPSAVNIGSTTKRLTFLDSPAYFTTDTIVLGNCS